LNYYPHHIGDYLRDTSHLTLTEHGAYRRMLDLYYASEKPLPLDPVWVSRLVRAESQQEREAVQFVLDHFFEKCEDGWRNKRADAEIRSAIKRTKAARTNGKRGGRPITQRVTTGLAKTNPTETQVKAPNNQKPITNNQDQRTDRSPQRSRGSRLPPDWKPSEILEAWAVKERPDLDMPAVVEKFGDYWRGVPGSRGVKLDWEATFRNFIRTEKPGSKPKEIDMDAFVKRIEEEDRKRAGS
jgi:uncharacterized protein YdaU (DUF1376 family)